MFPTWYAASLLIVVFIPWLSCKWLYLLWMRCFRHGFGWSARWVSDGLISFLLYLSSVWINYSSVQRTHSEHLNLHVKSVIPFFSSFDWTDATDGIAGFVKVLYNTSTNIGQSLASSSGSLPYLSAQLWPNFHRHQCQISMFLLKMRVYFWWNLKEYLFLTNYSISQILICRFTLQLRGFSNPSTIEVPEGIQGGRLQQIRTFIRRIDAQITPDLDSYDLSLSSAYEADTSDTEESLPAHGERSITGIMAEEFPRAVNSRPDIESHGKL